MPVSDDVRDYYRSWKKLSPKNYIAQDAVGISKLDFSRIVKEMLELLGVSVSKNAVLETNMDPNLPAVRANAAQLRQIVMNL
jgi:nitrogen-specific signal transduction histidine kinase